GCESRIGHERQSRLFDPVPKQGKGAGLCERFTPGEGDTVNIGYSCYTGRELVDRDNVCGRKGPVCIVEASPAPDRTSLHPDDSPAAGTVHLRPREKTRKVEFVFSSASGVAELMHHHFSAACCIGLPK